MTVVREVAGTASDLHAVAMPTTGIDLEVWVLRPHAPALVMGSSQKPDQFDVDLLDADGVELASRRSGGGAVYINPAATVWLDVLVPASHRLWSRELTTTFTTIGQIWKHAFEQLGLTSTMIDEATPTSPAASLACWAGFGWGELMVNSSKIVGLSQRRTRWGARVQCMAVLDDSAVLAARYLTDRALAARSVTRLGLETAIGSGHGHTVGSIGVERDAVEAAVVAAFDRMS